MRRLLFLKFWFGGWMGGGGLGEKSMFSRMFGSKIELIPLSNRKIDVFKDFGVTNRVGTSFEPQNRCFR